MNRLARCTPDRDTVAGPPQRPRIAPTTDRVIAPSRPTWPPWARLVHLLYGARPSSVWARPAGLGSRRSPGGGDLAADLAEADHLTVGSRRRGAEHDLVAIFQEGPP